MRWSRWALVFAPLLLLLSLHGQVSAQAESASLPALVAKVPQGHHRGPQDREIIATVLGLVVAVIVLFNWRTLRALPGANWWFAALLVRLCAWSADMSNGFVQSANLHLMVHAALTLSTGLAAAAVWRSYRIVETSEPSRE